MGPLIDLAKRAVPSSFKQRLKAHLMEEFQVPSMEWSLRNMQRLGFSPKAIVDIGAFEGEWTRMAKKIFPQALGLMIEAQENKRPKLDEVKNAWPGSLDYRIALLGSEERESVTFNQYESAPTASSVLCDQKSSVARRIVCPMRTLDAVLQSCGDLKPDLIKLDVQGYELEILKGGKGALLTAEAVLMEVSLVEIYQGNPLLHDVTRFMSDHDYLAYDISSLVRRPLDHALCQIDVIFVKNGTPLVKAKVWE